MADCVVDAATSDVEAATADDQERLDTSPGGNHQQDTQTEDDDDDDDDGAEDEEEEQSGSELPFPLFASKVFYLLDQTTAPRRWCLRLISSPYPFRRLPALDLNLITRNAKYV